MVKVLKGQPVPQVKLVKQALRAPLGPSARKAMPVQQAPKVPQVLEAALAKLDPKGLQVRKVIRARRVHKDQPDPKEKKDPLAHKAHRD